MYYRKRFAAFSSSYCMGSFIKLNSLLLLTYVNPLFNALYLKNNLW